MEEKQQGLYAFPLHPGITDPKFAGMTLRDYFAAKAMQGILSNPNIYGVKTMFEDDLSYLSYNFADMMLKQREL